MGKAEFQPDFIEAVKSEREVGLTTFGRKSGKPRTVTIWITTDGRRVFVRSGGGMERDWPQNLLARGEGELHVGKHSVKVKPRRLTDPSEARSTSRLARDKYGSYVKPSKPSEPLTKGELASFELLPAD